MHVAFVTPECFPFATTGGLGEVAGGLSKAIAQRGHEIRVFFPLYGCIQPQSDWYKTNNIPVLFQGRVRWCSVWTHTKDGVTYQGIEYQDYFGGPQIYTGSDADGERFAFFDVAVLSACAYFRWFPDVLHAHDWTTGLIPVLLNTVFRGTPLYRVATAFTIHNLQYQGLFSPNILRYAGIPYAEFHANSLEALGYVNFLKGALYHAMKLTTVSPHYAQEVQTPTFGCGLDSVLRFQSAHFIGVLNGIDETVWNPETDPFLAAYYTAYHTEPKRLCKRVLQQQSHLPEASVPLLGIVGRLCEQKGLDVLIAILPHLFAHIPMQMVVLGRGEPILEAQLKALEAQFPEKLRVYLRYEETLAHQIYAGCDLCVMPSRFEPCGLNQMYAMRYGALPIVRATGGLVDTVENCEESTGEGCGFVFQDLTNDALYRTIEWACSIYTHRPSCFESLQRNALQKNFCWKRSASLYESIYRWAIERRCP